MKKSSFAAMMLGTVSMFLFALGMCMTLLPEWNAFKPGIIFGVVGFVLGLITVFVWRKMENKAPIRINGRYIAVSLFATVGALIFGIGMCFCLVWENFVFGIIFGFIGLILLLLLIPLIKGIK